MQTITLSKSKYTILRKRAELYEKFLKDAPEKIFGLEFYTDNIIKELLKEDKLDAKTLKQLKKLFKP